MKIKPILPVLISSFFCTSLIMATPSDASTEEGIIVNERSFSAEEQAQQQTLRQINGSASDDKTASSAPSKESDDESEFLTKDLHLGPFQTTHICAFHNLQEVTSSGHELKLDDGSSWKVYPHDQFHASAWWPIWVHPEVNYAITPNISKNYPYSQDHHYPYCITSINNFNPHLNFTVRIGLSPKVIYSTGLSRFISAINYYTDCTRITLNDGSLWDLPYSLNRVPTSHGDYDIVAQWHINDMVVIGCNDTGSKYAVPNILINVNFDVKNYAVGSCINY